MIVKNASMLDVLSAGTRRDSCVVLPTHDHAVQWWTRIIDMFEDSQSGMIMRTKTAIILKGSQTAVRLWVPYEPDPTQPMDFVHEFVFRCDYLLLYGLVDRRAIKWA
jgi:hypothetical protein